MVISINEIVWPIEIISHRFLYTLLEVFINWSVVEKIIEIKNVFIMGK